MKLKLSILALILVMIYSCTTDDNPGSTDPKTSDFDRELMLTNWSDNIIIPAYTDFKTQLNGLKNTFDRFKISTATAANLEELRTAWLTAYKSWQHVSMFEIGPAEALDYRLQMNIYPSDASKINSNINTLNYDFQLPANRDSKGFPALDYMLYGLADTDAEIITTYNGANRQNYLQYLDDVITEMQSLTNTVLIAWNGDYRSEFVANSGSSATASVDRFVNDYILYYERFLRAGKMGIPLGKFSSTTLVENLEGYHNGEVSKALFLEGLTATQNLFNGLHYSTGAQGESFSSYLNALNTVKNGEDLSSIINNQFETARRSIQGLDSFKTEISENDPPIDMLNAYDEVQRMVSLFKVDMVSSMSISIDFVDADGD